MHHPIDPFQFRYISWLRPERAQTASVGAPEKMKAEDEEGGASPGSWDDVPSLPDEQSQQAWPGQASEPYQLPSLGVTQSNSHKKSATPSALSLLLTSSIFKSMRERSSNVDPIFDSVGGASFMPGPSTSRLYDETFSPHVNSQYELDYPPSYGSSGVEVTATASQVPPYSQSPAYWDPFVPPLTSQQLTSC